MSWNRLCVYVCLSIFLWITSADAIPPASLDDIPLNQCDAPLLYRFGSETYDLAFRTCNSFRNLGKVLGQMNDETVHANTETDQIKRSLGWSELPLQTVYQTTEELRTSMEELRALVDDLRDRLRKQELEIKLLQIDLLDLRKTLAKSKGRK